MSVPGRTLTSCGQSYMKDSMYKVFLWMGAAIVISLAIAPLLAGVLFPVWGFIICPLTLYCLFVEDLDRLINRR